MSGIYPLSYCWCAHLTSMSSGCSVHRCCEFVRGVKECLFNQGSGDWKLSDAKWAMHGTLHISDLRRASTTTCMYGHTCTKGMDQPCKVANPARVPCLRSRLRIWSRETGAAVPSRISLLNSILRLNLVLTYGIPPEFCGGVHLLM